VGVLWTAEFFSHLRSLSLGPLTPGGEPLPSLGDDTGMSPLLGLHSDCFFATPRKIHAHLWCSDRRHCWFCLATSPRLLPVYFERAIPPAASFAHCSLFSAAVNLDTFLPATRRPFPGFFFLLAGNAISVMFFSMS